MAQPFRIEVAGETNVGRKRNHNEDNFAIMPVSVTVESLLDIIERQARPLSDADRAILAPAATGTGWPA